jgi:hypothetical protein
VITFIRERRISYCLICHGIRIFKFLDQLLSKFVENELRGYELISHDAVFEQLVACAAGDEGGDQDIRIKDYSHEMRSNTSCSVKAFPACDIIRSRRFLNRRMKR